MSLDLINIWLDIIGAYIGGQPTIKGDGRLGHYDTTHTDQFQGRWNAAPPTLPAVSVVFFCSFPHFGTAAAQFSKIHLAVSLVVEVLLVALGVCFLFLEQWGMQ